MVGHKNYPEINSQNSFSFSLLFAVAFIFSALRSATTPVAVYITFGILLAWSFLAFLGNPKSFFYVLNKPQTKTFIVFLAFNFFTAIYNGGLLYTTKIMGSYLIIFSPFIFFEYYKKTNPKKLEVLLCMSILIFFLYVFKALIFYYIHPVAARILAGNQEAFGDIAIGGGYSLAYGSTIFAVFLLDIVLNKKMSDKRVKFYSLVALIPLYALVLQTKSSITIIVLFLGIIFSLFFKYISWARRNITLKFFIATFVLFCSILFFILFYKNIGFWIIDLTENSTDIVSLRIKEFGYLLSSGPGRGDYLTGRLGLSSISLSSFLHNPVIGRGYEYGYVWEKSHLFIGQHNEWADMLGNMGISGSILFFFILFFAIKSERKLSRNYFPPTYIWTYIFLGLFNALRGFQPMFILLFVIPALSFLYFSKKLPAEK